jgi:diaminopimelate epimerase
MKFEKYHALGNDYLVYNPNGIENPFSESETIRICHRNFGLGSDGILVGPSESKNANFKLQILNPDGSEAEKSGNGLRIFARYLLDTGQVTTDPFQGETLGGVVSCQVSEDKSTLLWKWERVSFRSDMIPVNNSGEAEKICDESIEVNGKIFNIIAATIGNPHCVDSG